MTPIKPVNDTQLNHRGRDRSTDLKALRRLYCVGSVEWNDAQIKRLKGLEK